MEQSDPTLEQLVGAIALQLRALADEVERHGTELGTLTDALLTLIARHAQEAPPAWTGLAAEQVEADHRTLCNFAGPLATARQAPDRLRQRVEHLLAALAHLPARPPQPGPLPPALAALFPLPEERQVFDELAEADDAQPPLVEIFR